MVNGQSPLFTQYHAPNLQYSKVWSDIDFYYVLPSTGTFSSGIVTFKSQNHNLVSGDVVSVISSDDTSEFNQTNVTVTVVDKDTFTVPYGSNPGNYDYNAMPQYGPIADAERLSITCTKYSKLIFKPEGVQVDALPAGMTITIQGKIHPDAQWVDLETVNTADGATMVEFGIRYNIVRCVKTTGTGTPLVYVQYRGQA